MGLLRIVGDAATHHLAALAVTLADPWQRLALGAAVLAAALIVVSSFVKTIIPLRWLAVASNIGFIVYGYIHPSPLILALHATLLPVNLWRVLEMERLTSRVRRASAADDQSGLWLQPHMRRRRMAPGSVLFRKGDAADRLYMLAEGEMEIVESGRKMETGRMFGEIAFFAPDRRRTATARCTTACIVLSIDESTFKQLYYQNPEFGFEIVRLIAGRLTEDVQRLQGELAAQRRSP